MTIKKCPYCKKSFYVFLDRVVQDGEELDEMNSEITIEKIIKKGEEQNES